MPLTDQDLQRIGDQVRGAGLDFQSAQLFDHERRLEIKFSPKKQRAVPLRSAPANLQKYDIGPNCKWESLTAEQRADHVAQAIAIMRRGQP